MTEERLLTFLRISHEDQSLQLNKKTLERWVSGLNQQFAKLPYGKLYRGFESPSLRKAKAKHPDDVGMFFVFRLTVQNLF